VSQLGCGCTNARCLLSPVVSDGGFATNKKCFPTRLGWQAGAVVLIMAGWIAPLAMLICERLVL